MRIVANVRNVQKALNRIERAISPAGVGRYSAQVVSEAVERQAKLSFREQADPVTGKPWAKRKSGKDSGRATLIKTGSLRRGTGAESEIKGKKAYVRGYVEGNAEPYALTHQEGSPSQNIPQRRYMGLSEHDWQKISNRIARYIEGAI